MGVPVSPRNIFPSNIQGLPTWYEVRVNEKGYLARRGGVDLMVAMNPQTWDKDLEEIEPGGYLLYDSSKPMPASRFRSDIHVLGVPLTDLCATRYTDPRERQLLKNIVYVGVLAAMLGVEPEVIATLLGEQYKGKAKLLQPNLDAFMMGLHHGREYFDDALGLQDRAPRRGRKEDLHRRQRRRGARLRLRRRDGLRLVSDHAELVARRGASRSTAPSCASTRRPARTSSRSSRPRTRSPRSASSSAPAGTAPGRSPPPPARASR